MRRRWGGGGGGRRGEWVRGGEGSQEGGRRAGRGGAGRGGGGGLEGGHSLFSAIIFPPHAPNNESTGGIRAFLLSCSHVQRTNSSTYTYARCAQPKQHHTLQTYPKKLVHQIVGAIPKRYVSHVKPPNTAKTLQNSNSKYCACISLQLFSTSKSTVTSWC